MVSLAKRILIGRPIATSEEGHQRLRKRVALPIFASDAISSTAYATDEIVLVLALQAGIGLAAFDHLVPIAIVVAVLLDDRRAVVPPDDLRLPVGRRRLRRVAGEPRRDRRRSSPAPSLLTDYILTVAVSVAGGVLAIQSAFGFDSQWRVPLCLLLIVVMTLANLRGLQGVGLAVRPADVPLHRHAGRC